MCARLLVPLFLLLACPLAQAGSVLVIDDFTDPARIEFPDGPETAVTQGVGQLNAERLLETRQVLPDKPRILLAEVAAEKYTVDMEDAGDLTFVDIEYSFDTQDFTHYKALRLHISAWPQPSPDPWVVPSLPGLMVVAEVDEEPGFPGNLQLVYRPSPFFGIYPGVLTVPLASFTDRAGGPIDQAEWTRINAWRVTVGAHSSWGPWGVTLDRISLGPAVPEPTTLCVLTGCGSWLFFSCYLRRRRSHVS